MQEIFHSYNPILLITAISLTIMSSYTAIDLLMLIHSSVRNKRFLFLGGTLSMGLGIWVMNFIGVLAIDINRSLSYNIPVIFLSLIIGISFTGMSFYSVIDRVVTRKHLIIGSLLMTCSVFSISIIGIYGMNMGIKYHFFLLLFTAIFIFSASFFVFWLFFQLKSLSSSNQIWLKPVGALIGALTVLESHFLFIKAANLKDTSNLGTATQETFIVYIVLFVSILILSGLIGSSALISKRWAATDNHLKDIQTALDESSIVVITDPDGKITYLNQKFEQISKFTQKELIGQKFELLHSKYHNTVFFQELWNTISNGHVWKGELYSRDKDGAYYWVDTTIVPFLDDKGKPYQYVSIHSDITNKIIFEQNLESTLKEIDDIKFALDQSTIVAFTDSKGRIANVNDNFCSISGFTREELIGKDHRIVNSNYHSKSFFSHMWNTISNGEVWKGEIRNKSKNGTYYWVDTTIVPFINEEGKPYQYLSIRNDITEKKKTEEILHRQDKLAAIGQLAAGVAHEIRNPLTSIKGYAEFLHETENNEERKEFVGIILDEIDRINLIVEDFMLLAKPKAVQLEEKNIIPIIQNILSLLEFEARKKQIRIFFDPKEEIIQIECDEDRIKQVFLNLIKNGMEAMPSGGELTVKVYIEDQHVHIIIQDTGVGIPEEKLKDIGEPFYTTKKEGNGLGLMVSFKIIENHNGKVFIDSELNKGTTFSIVLPTKTA